MGISGSGKTTLGMALADTFNYLFLEGDTFHSEANKNKMKSGIPLTDSDRLPWLEEINKRLQAPSTDSIVLACSALKENYRKIITQGLPKDGVVWISLEGDYNILKKRMENRTHFMPSSLLDSQLEVLESPKNAIVLNCSLSIKAMIELLKQQLNES